MKAYICYQQKDRNSIFSEVAFEIEECETEE